MTDNYRLPAEWEPHAATWIGWPHNVTDWPGKFPPIPWVYGEIVRKLAPGEVVRILVNSRAQQAQASRILKQVGVDLARADFLPFPTNRGWTRDFGPIFVRGDKGLAIARFHFNAWAKYKDWKKDDRIPERAAKRLKLPLIEAKIVLEGGSIDVNGRGTLLTTEECLLDSKVQTRNPGLSRLEIETVFQDTLGITNTLWLGKGIAGDDTHGHVDDLCRFVKPGTVVLCREDNPKDVNYKPLAVLRERFVIDVLRIVLATQNDRARFHEAAQIIHVAVRVVACNPFAEPERIRDAESIVEDGLDLEPGQSGVAGLHLGIEQAFFRREQRAATVHIDAAALENNLRLDQRKLEPLRCALGDPVVFLPVLVLRPGVEMEARDGEALISAHENRSEVPRPAAVGRKGQKVRAGEVHSDLLQDSTGLGLLSPGVDQYADHFARRQLANYLAVHPGDRREFPGPIGDVVRPADPGRRMRLPLGR